MKACLFAGNFLNQKCTIIRIKTNKKDNASIVETKTKLLLSMRDQKILGVRGAEPHDI